MRAAWGWILLLGPALVVADDTETARLAAASASGEWLTQGGDYGETRFGPLEQISRSNVADLGLAWSVEVGSIGGKVEATPLVVDGAMYGTTTWSVTYAIDLDSGALKWRWDPQVSRENPPQAPPPPAPRPAARTGCTAGFASDSG